MEENKQQNCENAQNECFEELEEQQNENVEQEDKFANLSLNECQQLLKKMQKLLEKTTADLLEATKKTNEYKDKWYRSAAEFENFKKRNEQTRKNAYDDGKKDSVTLLLPVGDSLDRALSVEMDEKTKNGVMLVLKQFQESLNAFGVEEINPLNEAFNPQTMEAIATVDKGDKEENLVSNVYKKGYTINGKILRYAQVVVTK